MFRSETVPYAARTNLLGKEVLTYMLPIVQLYISNLLSRSS